MALSDWTPAITTAGLFAAALWLARNLIATRLRTAVEYEFDAKLERVRTDLRNAEERFRSDLRARDSEISALRSGALTALASRHVALDKRRLEAVDQLWSAVTTLNAGRLLVANMAIIDFDKSARRAESDNNVRKFFDAMSAGFDLSKLDLRDAARARPYVTPMAWAVYSAMLAIITHAFMQVQALRGGLGATDFVDRSAVIRLIAAALPHLAEFAEKHGPAGYVEILGALDTRLLDELAATLAGTEADRASIERAAEIVRQANAVIAQSTPRAA